MTRRMKTKLIKIKLVSRKITFQVKCKLTQMKTLTTKTPKLEIDSRIKSKESKIRRMTPSDSSPLSKDKKLRTNLNSLNHLITIVKQISKMTSSTRLMVTYMMLKMTKDRIDDKRNVDIKNKISQFLKLKYSKDGSSSMLKIHT